MQVGGKVVPVLRDRLLAERVLDAITHGSPEFITRMRQAFLFLGLTLIAYAQPRPVLVELFTSEGCSSCPPADALLGRLDAQPFAGIQIIALSEHVDYWNHQGWSDPYSSAALTARQQEYSRRFGKDGPYTPEMVVDGRSEFVGSDAGAAESAIRSAAGQPRVAISIADEGGRTVVEVGPLPQGRGKAAVFVAHVANSGMQNVLGGENKGRQLKHVAIVKDLKRVGTVDNRSGFKTQVHSEAGTRLIVFVQEPGNGPVLGAAMRL
jgi:hypothetical protein